MATVGEFTNVPEPGAAVASPWAQQVTNQVVHRFANRAALDAWTTAQVGTLAITLDDGVMFRRVSNFGGGWARQTPLSLAVVGNANPGTVGQTAYTVATLPIPNDVGPRKLSFVFHALMTYSSNPGDIEVRLNATAQLKWRPIAATSYMVTIAAHNVSVPAHDPLAMADSLSVVAAATSSTPTTFVDPYFNQLNATITPA